MNGMSNLNYLRELNSDRKPGFWFPRVARLLAVFVVHVLLAPLLAGQTATSNVQFRPCEITGTTGRVECREFRVAENRGVSGGRTIPLQIVILRATGEATAADPVYPLQGGPGQAVTSLASFYGNVFAEIRQSRDIVLVDFRGTGKSNGLYCDPRAPGPLLELFSLERIRVCRESLSRQADLTQYNTAANVEDILVVLDALGIAKVNLYGTSYGTRAAFELLRRSPHRIRTATLKAVVPPGMISAKDFSRDAYGVLSAVLTADDQARLERLLQQPQAEMSPGVFSEVIRNLLYSPQSARQLAERVRDAERGDRSFFDKAAAGNPWGTIALGMFLSVSCTEDAHPVPRRTASAPTVRTLGAFRELQQATACAHWAPVKKSTAHRKQVSSDVPALLLSGDLDPVTPPRWGERAVRNLKNGVHIVLRNNGHAMGDQAKCIAKMMKTLIDEGSIARIRPECEIAPSQN